MTTEEKAKAYDEALEAAQKELKQDLHESGVWAIKRIFPQLAEDEDERIRKAILGLTYIDGIEPILTKCSITAQDIRAYLEKQKENIEKEYVFRPLAGTDITIAAEQAIRRVNEGDRLVLAFNGAYIPVRKGCNANKIVNIYDAFIEKQKDASKAIEAVDRIDKYIDEHLANAHDIKDSNPNKKYYRGWDDALGKMAGILQDVYSGEKQKEQNKCPEFCSGHCVGCERNEQKEQKPAEWSEEDEDKLEQCIRIVRGWEGDYDIVKSPYSNFLKSLPERFNLQPKQEWSEEEAKKAAEDYADKYPGMTHENDGSTIEDYDKPYNDFMAGVLWAKHQGIFQNGNTHKKPSEEKKKETLDGADIGYGLETAIDILENGFTHYQTDDGEYERNQALDVLIFLLNETRKKEDAKLWSKDIVESIVTWATEKLQLYSMKESTPYVEAVKNNAQKVLDWAKEQWPIYYGWKPSEEQMKALLNIEGDLRAFQYNDKAKIIAELYEQLKKL